MNIPLQMNSSAVPAQAAQQAPLDDQEDINFLKLLDVVLDSRWLIASVTALGLLIGVAYALLTTPIYEANTLIQVEDSKSGNGLGEVTGNLFEVSSSASAEMEILRSRLVVGQAVSNLQLDLSVTPVYTPLIGEWLARKAKEPSDPGFMGFGNYVSGNESLRIAQFDIPDAWQGRAFQVVASAQGFELLSPLEKSLGQGLMGQPFSFELDGQKGRILVSRIIGKPGATFTVVRSSRLRATERLQNQLAITEQGRQTGIIRASLEGSDPAAIARILNEVSNLYLGQNIERRAAEAQKSLGFLDTQLPQLRAELEASEGKFNKFRNISGTFDLGAEATTVLTQSVSLQTTLLGLEQKRTELLARFTPLHPSVQAVNTQIATIQSELGALANKAKSFPDTEQDLLRLTRDVKANSEIYASLLNSYQQLRLVKEGKVGNVRIVDVAAIPESAIKPKRSQAVAIAVLGGLMLGLALAFLRNSLRPGLRDPTEIERHGLAVFGSIPHSLEQIALTAKVKKKTSGSHVLALKVPQDQVVESLRSLRTALQFAMLEARNNIVLITGPTPGIGKSFTSVNFAAVLGAANKRVLLVDSDMRKGHLNQYFGLSRPRGLSEVLVGSLNFEAAVHRQVMPNVDFVSTGLLPPNPAELFMTSGFQSLMSRVSSDYDLVLIDTPPVLAASDTAIIAPVAGTLFLVARSELTSISELQESVRRLSHNGIRVTGVIFNDLNTEKRRYRYGLGYSYGGYRYTNYKY